MVKVRIKDNRVKSAHHLLNQAENMVSRGDYLAAINLLQSSGEYNNREIAQRLIELRIEAYSHLNWPKPSTSWPPAHDDRFEAIAGIPEVPFSELDVPNLKAGIIGKGALIVRGMMSDGLIAEMRGMIDCVLRARMEANDEKANNENPWYYRSERVKGGPAQLRVLRGDERYTTVGSAWSVDSPPVAFRIIEFFHDIGLPNLLNAYFDEKPVLSVRKWVVRCAPPNNGAQAGWHQDGRFLGDPKSIRTVNLWIALSDCGPQADAPGLEIISGTGDKIFDTGTQGAEFDWTVSPEIVKEIARTNPVQCPNFSAGDAIFFDHFNLHRTGFGQNHTLNRYAIESWFFAGSAAPLKQQPVVF